jgi:hypothetical protein
VRQVKSIASFVSRCLLVILAVVESTIGIGADRPRFLPPPDDDYSYARRLMALGEESLCCGENPAKQVVRFTWLRTFHQPVVIKMERLQDDSWTLRTKVASGAAGFDPGSVIIDETRTLAKDEVASVQSKLARGSAFWSIPSTESLTRVREDGTTVIVVSTDGARWVIEVRDVEAYHYVDRNSPKSGFVRDLGLMFISLSKREFGTVY